MQDSSPASVLPYGDRLVKGRDRHLEPVDGSLVPTAVDCGLMAKRWKRESKGPAEKRADAASRQLKHEQLSLQQKLERALKHEARARQRLRKKGKVPPEADNREVTRLRAQLAAEQQRTQRRSSSASINSDPPPSDSL
jgi:hypothetical protein